MLLDAVLMLARERNLLSGGGRSCSRFCLRSRWNSNVGGNGPGVRHKAGAGFTFSGMDHERYAAWSKGRTTLRSGLNPSGPRAASAFQR